MDNTAEDLMRILQDVLQTMASLATRERIATSARDHIVASYS